jgi:hypothetical protein
MSTGLEEKSEKISQCCLPGQFGLFLQPEGEELDMTDDLRKVIASALCTFGADIDRDHDGYTQIVAANPHKPCEEICDYCRTCAVYILQKIGESQNGNQ